VVGRCLKTIYVPWKVRVNLFLTSSCLGYSALVTSSSLFMMIKRPATYDWEIFFKQGNTLLQIHTKILLTSFFHTTVDLIYKMSSSVKWRMYLEEHPIVNITKHNHPTQQTLEHLSCWGTGRCLLLVSTAMVFYISSLCCPHLTVVTLFSPFLHCSKYLLWRWWHI